MQPNKFYQQIQTFNFAETLPKAAVAPKFGLSQLCADAPSQTVYAATKGGLVVKYCFALNLQEKALEEVYESSDDEENNQADQQKIAQAVLKFSACANLDLNTLLAGTAASTSITSIMSQTAAF